jgi:hypothetical protein
MYTQYNNNIIILKKRVKGACLGSQTWKHIAWDAGSKTEDTNSKAYRIQRVVQVERRNTPAQVR